VNNPPKGGRHEFLCGFREFCVDRRALVRQSTIQALQANKTKR